MRAQPINLNRPTPGPRPRRSSLPAIEPKDIARPAAGKTKGLTSPPSAHCCSPTARNLALHDELLSASKTLAPADPWVSTALEQPYFPAAAAGSFRQLHAAPTHSIA